MPPHHPRSAEVIPENFGRRFNRSAPFEPQFWSKVDRRGDDECWNWTGAILGTGYGQIHYLGRPTGVHRIAWQLTNGRPIPAGLMVCHTCDNRRCCNPAHLWLGSNQDNQRDAAAKGRSRYQGNSHCIRGHEFTPENTVLYLGRLRRCRACMAHHRLEHARKARVA